MRHFWDTNFPPPPAQQTPPKGGGGGSLSGVASGGTAEWCVQVRILDDQNKTWFQCEWPAGKSLDWHPLKHTGTHTIELVRNNATLFNTTVLLQNGMGFNFFLLPEVHKGELEVWEANGSSFLHRSTHALSTSCCSVCRSAFSCSSSCQSHFS